MEGVYEKLIGNSGKLSALGHLICSFSNCFQNSSGSRSFVVVTVKIAQVVLCAANIHLGRGPALSAVLNGRGNRASSAPACGSWSRVAFALLPSASCILPAGKDRPRLAESWVSSRVLLEVQQMCPSAAMKLQIM